MSKITNIKTADEVTEVLENLQANARPWIQTLVLQKKKKKRELIPHNILLPTNKFLISRINQVYLKAYMWWNIETRYSMFNVCLNW
jgi:hypothetical protein